LDYKYGPGTRPGLFLNRPGRARYRTGFMQSTHPVSLPDLTPLQIALVWGPRGASNSMKQDEVKFEARLLMSGIKNVEYGRT
jgi:hypothetical protein